jgi:RNA polymerase sigma factor (sigma-70 family)
MYNVSFRIVGREDEAEDVLQESFISAFRNLQSYRGESSFGSWLKKIVVNKAINVLQKKRMEPLPDHEDWDMAEPDAPVEYGAGLTVEAVKKAIQQLPDGYRSVLSLYLLEGYEHQEIAEIMGITESTSKSQLNRAKNKLREVLQGKTKNLQD